MGIIWSSSHFIPRLLTVTQSRLHQCWSERWEKVGIDDFIRQRTSSQKLITTRVQHPREGSPIISLTSIWRCKRKHLQNVRVQFSATKSSGVLGTSMAALGLAIAWVDSELSFSINKKKRHSNPSRWPPWRHMQTIPNVAVYSQTELCL